MTSAKPLFKATKPKPHNDVRQGALIDDLALQAAPERLQDLRDPLDFDPTPFSATRAFLAREGARMRAIGGPVWENAAGLGHIAHVLAEQGFEVIGSDLVDRPPRGGMVWPGLIARGLEDWQAAPAAIVVTNPPYNRINARDGGGWWLTRTLDLGARYVALLLNADWPAAAGLGPVLAAHPFARYYICRWKIDFRGGGSPPQRNAWIVWDLDGPDPAGQRMLFLDRADDRQAELLP